MENTITVAYSNLLTEMQDHQKAAERAARLRNALEFMIMAATRDGQITGKNETERKVASFSLFERYYREVAEAEEDERRAKFRLEYARTIVEQQRALLRVAELNARTQSDEEPR